MPGCRPPAVLYTLSMSSSGNTGYMHEGHDKSVGIAVRGAQPTTLFSALPQEKGDQSGILHGQHTLLCHRRQSFGPGNLTSKLFYLLSLKLEMNKAVCMVWGFSNWTLHEVMRLNEIAVIRTTSLNRGKDGWIEAEAFQRSLLHSGRSWKWCGWPNQRVCKEIMVLEKEQVINSKGDKWKKDQYTSPHSVLHSSHIGKSQPRSWSHFSFCQS